MEKFLNGSGITLTYYILNHPSWRLEKNAVEIFNKKVNAEVNYKYFIRKIN